MGKKFFNFREGTWALRSILIISSLLAGTAIGYYGKAPLKKVISFNPFDDTTVEKWPTPPYELIEIPSSADNTLQKAFVYRSTSDKPEPLVVSLHSWSAGYAQKDFFREQVLEKNWNYIHPDFRGPNNQPQACASDLVISDIDDAIDYALKNFNVDKERIYVIGGSGGAYAGAASIMKSKHTIRQYSIWNPITDIHAWYYQSKIRNLKYEGDIMLCTDSKNGQLDEEEAKKRSPLYWQTPVEKFSATSVKIYAGIYDGVLGAVPFTHAINFYNKLVSDLNCPDSSKLVSEMEKAMLMEKGPMLPQAKMLGDRKVVLHKSYQNVELILFEGRHELLANIVLETLDN